uniref:UDP-glycosyltransferase n=1 Tax=Seonamhaeicola sp. TaxID=1912245 RepID=UPI003563E34A
MFDKILVIAESIDVNDSSGSKANMALILNLKALGYRVSVFHYTQKELQLEGIPCYAIKENKRSINFILSRAQRIFTRITGIKLHRFFEGLFGFSFTFFNDVQSIKKALLKEVNYKPDLVLTLSKGASFRPHYALVAIPKWHHIWMAYIHDPYPFHYYPKPYDWVEPGYLKKELFFKKVSEKAAYSAFPSQLLKEWMGHYFPDFLKTGIVIPHQNFELTDGKEVELPTFFNTTKFNLLHAGNLMKQRSPKSLVEGFQLFLKKYPEAKKEARLLLIGSASYHSTMLAEYHKKIPEVFVKITNLPFTTVYKLQQQVAVNIILEATSDISPFLPGKFPHCVTANKPILHVGPQKSETKRLLGEQYPYSAAAEDIPKIASHIEKLYQLWIE